MNEATTAQNPALWPNGEAPPSEALVVSAPAKFNRFLEIEGRREDGFHEITTEMLTIDLADRIWAVRRSDAEVRLRTGGSLLPLADPAFASDNIVIRAARLIRSEAEGAGVPPSLGADIWLEKHVPTGAGLGGGSSDCAATLRLLNRLWGLELSTQRLESLAARLGSDTAFFVRGGRALCTGRGEIVIPLDPAPTQHLVLVWPRVSVSTPAVYRSGHIDLRSPRRAWSDGCEPFNRLSEACFAVEPRVRSAIETARAATGRRVLLSGSGAAFVVFAEGEADANALAVCVDTALGGEAFVRPCKTTRG